MAAQPTEQPLEGIRVLDFTQNLPGPWATFMLASMGAEVIKVEPPRGDPGRVMSGMFAHVNRGKKSVVLDLRDTESASFRDALLAWADVVVEGFRPGVMDRLGAGYAHTSSVNPTVVYASVSAFGQHGPRRDEPAHDLNVQALTGVCHTERDRLGPRGLVLPVTDLTTSLATVAAITSALAGRTRPLHLDLSMADSALAMSALWGEGVDLGAPLSDAATAAGAAGPIAVSPLVERLRRKKLFVLPHYGLFPCRDGAWLALGIVDEQKFWKAMCEVLALPRMSHLPLPMRILMGPVLRPLVAARLRMKTRDQWLELLAARDVPASPVQSPEEARRDPQFLARGLVDEHGEVRAPLPGSRHIRSPAPGLGADTVSVREMLGLGDKA